MVLEHRNGHRHTSLSIANVASSVSFATQRPMEGAKSREGKRGMPLQSVLKAFATLVVALGFFGSYIMFMKWIVGTSIPWMERSVPSREGAMFVPENLTWSLRGRTTTDQVTLDITAHRENVEGRKENEDIETKEAWVSESIESETGKQRDGARTRSVDNRE